jgi:hypothetical protein
MVLVLAALYTYHQYSQDGSEADTDTGTSSTQRVQVLKRQISTRLQDLVGRRSSCTTPASAEDAQANCIALQGQPASDSSKSSKTMEQPTADDDQSPMGSPDLEGSPRFQRTIIDDVYRENVKTEWIDAVFGPNFDRVMPRKGMGLSGMASYQTVTCTIPKGCEGNKVGLTVSRLALGLYVRAIEVGSEAFYAGVQENSVLVSINGMGILAEASNLALERIWQYEGHHAVETVDLGKEAQDGPKRILEPTRLTFIRNSSLYTVLLLSNPPWGISWAPCGNFPLVKRVYAHAATAGIPKGSLVAKINNRTFREMDHATTALYLRDLFQDGKEITITCCYTPASAKTSYMEKQLELKSAAPKPRFTKKTEDGVEIKFHTFESLCHAGGFQKETLAQKDGTAAELAEMVAAGLSLAPNGMSTRRQLFDDGIVHSRTNPYIRSYSRCPKLPKEQLLDGWNVLDALLFCLRLDQVDYDENHLLVALSKASEEPQVESLQYLTSSPAGARMVDGFLQQFISVICSPSLCAEEEEVETKKNANDVTAILLKLSRKDEGFCQKLYFLLRSYISSFETRRPSGNEGSRNLMAIMHCLELLRFAENELSGQTHNLPEPPSPPPGIVSVTDDSVASSVSTGATERGAASLGAIPLPETLSDDQKRAFAFTRKKKPMPVSKAMSPKQSPTPELPRRHVVTVEEPQEILETKALFIKHSPSTMYDKMSEFLSELDRICATVEGSLQKSFRQKIADWAMQPWSASKDTALAQVTQNMREFLRQSISASETPLVNPVQSSELLSSLDYDGCYVLPSAHFPLLLTFNVDQRRNSDLRDGQERLYKTAVRISKIRGSKLVPNVSYIVDGAVAGTIASTRSSQSSKSSQTDHEWSKANGMLKFDTRSSWGAPQTLSIRLSFERASRGQEEVGFSWIDLSQFWQRSSTTRKAKTFTCYANIIDPGHDTQVFDDQGDLFDSNRESIELELKVTVKTVNFEESGQGRFGRKRMLLYKHDDDLRQEAFAVQFIRTCDRILKASGLDMKLLTFECIPVGTNRGFVEWVPGSVALSEICQPFAGSILGDNPGSIVDEKSSSSLPVQAGLTKYESLRRLGGQQNQSLRSLGGKSATARFASNPIQEYLRGVAYDKTAPYFVCRDVMDRYIKSCAGYCVITYILGVGDRHLDNLLLHQSGSFFHCDFSFILGRDPKKRLPLRITKDMVNGMGGKHSDNFAKFLSLVGAAFLSMRRPGTVRVLLSMVRLMEFSHLPDVTENQTTEEAVLGMRDRLRLDLSEKQAVAFIEELVETSLSNRLWLAVDAIHSLGKKF